MTNAYGGKYHEQEGQDRQGGQDRKDGQDGWDGDGSDGHLNLTLQVTCVG